MKAKVTLTHTVTVFVEGESEDAIMAWLRETTPEGAKEMAKQKSVDENYDEWIDCFVMDDSVVDFHI